MFAKTVLLGMAALIAVTAAISDEMLPKRWQDIAYHTAQYQRLTQATATISSQVSFLEFLRPEHASADCGKCMQYAPIFVDLLKTTQGTDLLVSLVDAECDKALKKDKREDDLCRLIANATLQLASFVVDLTEATGFNNTVVLCSDILPLCSIPCCSTSYAPEQRHLSFTGGQAIGNPAMQVAWVTLEKAPAPAVQWRAIGAAEWSEASAVARTYTVSGWIGWNYGAVMTGLTAATTYEYRVGSDNVTAGWSDVANFTTLPTDAGTTARPLRIGWVADLGVGGHSSANINQLEELATAGRLDILVHTGDISYSDGDAYRWDRFMRSMEPITSRVPYMTIPGNHELMWNFTAYKTRFFTPLPEFGAPEDGLYYSFAVGKLRFVLLDSESWYDTPYIDDAQVAWLSQVLPDAQAQGQFIIVGMHRPMYCSDHSHNCKASAEYLRDRVEGLFYRYNVSLVHFGHVHNYERILPIFNGTVTGTSLVNPTAPMYVLNGAGDSVEGLNYFAPNQTFPDFSVKHITCTGYLYSSYHRNSAGTDVFSANFTRTTTMELIDSFTLEKW